MREPRVSQPELNYIFDYYNECAPRYSNLKLNVSVCEKTFKILNNKRAGLPLALVSCWKFGLERYGLSPFVLHYLTKSKAQDVWKFYKNLLKSGSFTTFYCGSTYLPVIAPRIYGSWSQPGHFYLADGGSPYLDGRIKESFHRNLPKYLAAKAEGKLTDEYMRNFGNSPIGKQSWMRLKGVVGIYE